jgi:hypothetical protein
VGGVGRIGAAQMNRSTISRSAKFMNRSTISRPAKHECPCR